MKKHIVLVLALFCVIALACCNAEGNEVMEDFVGIVTDINDDNTSYIVEVTDSGSSDLKVGDSVIVKTVNGSNAEYSVDDYINVEFNGVAEDLPAVSMADNRISRTFSIEKIGTSKNDTE